MLIPELGDLALAALVANTPVALAVADGAGRLAFVSPALERMLGRPFAALHYTEWVDAYELRDSDGRNRLPDRDVPLARALTGQLVTDEVITFRTADSCSTLRYLRCNAAPLRSSGGALVGAVVLIHDITTEQIALDGQAALRERLVETINHHLRTPLTSLIGHVELLQDARPVLTSDLRHSLDALAGAAEELLHLANVISALSELENKSHLAMTRGRVSELLQAVAADCSRPHDASRIHVRIGSVEDATLDFVEVRRALLALIDNARAYGPNDGSVELTAEVVHDQLYLAVTDQGDGVDKRDWDRLVQPFERGTQQQAHVTGRGLGLSLADTVATAHGGRLISTVTPTGEHRVGLLLPTRT